MATKQKATVTLKASADCPSHSLSNVSVRDLVFSIDEPVERGGTNTGPTPTDTALAALVGCTNVIGNKCAAQLGVDKTSGSATPEQLELVAEEVAKYCPLSKLFRQARTEIIENWQSA